MENTFLLVQNLLLLTISEVAWVPSKGFLFGVLVFGALFIAGVFLSVLTFYEDHYWLDERLREELRLNSSKREL